MSDHSELKKLADEAIVFAGLNGEISYAQEMFISAATPSAVLALIAEVEALTATGKFLGAGVDVLGPRCDQLKAEVEKLRPILSEARRMLNTVSECSSNECEDCREHAGLHRDGIDLVIGKSGES